MWLWVNRKDKLRQKKERESRAKTGNRDDHRSEKSWLTAVYFQKYVFSADVSRHADDEKRGKNSAGSPKKESEPYFLMFCF